MLAAFSTRVCSLNSFTPDSISSSHSNFRRGCWSQAGQRLLNCSCPLKGMIRMKLLKSYLFVIGCILVCLCSHAWAQTDITFGSTYAGTITEAAQTNSYAFTASANDLVDFTIAATAGALGPRMLVYSPDNALVASNDGDGCVASSELDTIKIPTTGTYTLLVSDCAGRDSATGSYGLYVQRTNNPGGVVAPLLYGQTAAGKIGLAVQSNTYTFKANANDLIDFTVSAPPNGLGPRIRIYYSNGTLFTSNDSLGCVATSEMDTVKVLTSGTYTMLVGDCAGRLNTTGGYDLYAQRTNNPSGAGYLPYDQVISGTITLAAQSNTYTFPAHANDLIDFTTTATSGSLGPRIRIYYPNGTLFTSNDSLGCVGTSTLDSITIPSSGTYAMLVGDCVERDNSTGDYDLSAQCLGVCPLRAPVLGSISPTSAIANGSGFPLTVKGSNFVSGSVVDWNGSSLVTTYISATELTAAVPAADIATAGSIPVTVTNPTPLVGPSNAVNFTVNNPVPSLGSLSPTSVTAGGNGFTLTLDGSNFVKSSVVKWNGVSLTTTYISAAELKAAVTAGDIATAVSASVSVYNPTPGGGTSSALTFTVNPPKTTPTVTAWPTASAITFGQTLASSKLSGGSASVAGNFAFTTSSTAPGVGTASQSVTFTPTSATDYNNVKGSVNVTVNSVNAPKLTSLSPASTIPEGSGFTLTVNGSGFVSGSKVQWNGSPLTTTYVSATQLTALVADSDVLIGKASVTVLNPAPGGGTSNALTFTIDYPVPVVMWLSPGSATAGGSSFTLTVNGFNFVKGATVQWNGSALTTTYISETQLQAVVPAGDTATTGSASITVANPAPSLSASNAVTFEIN